MGEVTRFRDDVVSRGNFTHDWFTMHVLAWCEELAPLKGRRARLLDVGAFEGMSTCFLLWWLRDAHVTSVDTFGEWHGATNLEQRFLHNVGLVDSTRIRTLAGKTNHVLSMLVDERAEFDFIYIDASHLALDVLVDASLCWRLLAPDGLLLLDDYGLDYGDRLLSPTVAVDAFMYVVGNRARREKVGRQVGLGKLRTAQTESLTEHAA
jgi:predicted O-methyltransferase YrrM